MPVEDVGAGGAGGGDLHLVGDPTVGEVQRVPVRRDARVLRVRPDADAVLRLVVTGVECIAVVDRRRTGRRVERAVALEQIDPGRTVGLAGVVDFDLDAVRRGVRGPREHVGAVPVDVAGLAVRLTRHERDLVVGVDVRVGVGAGPRVGVGVERRRLADRGQVLRCREVEDGTFVDLHRDLLPRAVDEAEGDEPVRGDALHGGDRRAGDHDRVVRAGDGRDVAPLARREGHGRDREQNQSHEASIHGERVTRSPVRARLTAGYPFQ